MDQAETGDSETVTREDIVERLTEPMGHSLYWLARAAVERAEAKEEIERLRAALDVVPGTVSDEVMEWAKPSFEAERALSPPSVNEAVKP